MASDAISSDLTWLRRDIHSLLHWNFTMSINEAFKANIVVKKNIAEYMQKKR